MPVPVQMTAHTLNPIKGWPRPNALDITAKISANVTIDPLYSGRCVHLNSSGELETGLPDTVGAGHMPLFLFGSSNDPDVENPGGDPATEPNGWVSAMPSGGRIGCLVAVGAYELETTEFEPVATAGTYTPGTTLTAVNANTNATTGGRITKGTAYSKPLCGVVSRGVYVNADRRNVLCFWPVWLPRQT